MWAEIKRKLFHLMGLVYVVALIFVPRATYLTVLGSLLAIDFAVELARLRVPAVRDWFGRRFGGLFREAEKTRLSGMFWMMAGVFLTVLITRPLPLAVSALLYLLLGDGVASLVGIRFGGPQWPRSKKRLSGSFACFVVCLFVGFVILRSTYGWPFVLIGALTATVVEFGIVPMDDNFSIPVFSSTVLLLMTAVSMFR